LIGKTSTAKATRTLTQISTTLCTGEIDKSMRADRAHHTPAQGNGERIYPWEFSDESIKLRVTLKWSESVTEVPNFVDYTSPKVTRAGEEVP
jgi:hypothetical protein